jgi:hypothetical protein
MYATVTALKQPTENEIEVTESEIEAAWMEHEYRAGVVRRYFEAVLAKDWDEAAFIWLEAGAYDEANPDCSPLLDELGITDLPTAA